MMIVRRDEIRTGERAVEIMPSPNADIIFLGRITTPWSDRLLCPRQGRLDGPICRIEVFAPWAPDKDLYRISPANPERLRNPNAVGKARHWIIEVHFVDRNRSFGGFYERLLLPDALGGP